MKEIKQPCPFCGGEPKEWFWVEQFKGNFACARIYCSKCNAKIEVRNEIDFNSQYNPGNTFLKSEDEVIEKWNNRFLKKR